MKSVCTLALLFLLMAAGLLRLNAAVVTWDGGAGDFVWQNRINWNSDALPTSVDDVIVDLAGNPTLITRSNVTVRSLQCTSGLLLTAGLFRVTSGNSQVQGQVSAIGNSLLSATGEGTSLTLLGAIGVFDGNLEATGGATLSLPTLVNHVKSNRCASVSWQANGARSVLDFPSLTNVVATDCSSVSFQAEKGGQVRLPLLAGIEKGRVIVVADGTNSLVDLPRLQQPMIETTLVDFEARNGGTIQFPQFTGGLTTWVGLRSGGVMPVTQLTQLGGFTVSGMTINFPGLTRLGGRNVLVEAGGKATAIQLLTHSEADKCPANSWVATGAGSVLEFSALSTLTGADCGFLSIQARSGGTVSLTQLTVLPEGRLNFLADGPDSLVDLSALQESPGTQQPIHFEASKNGSLRMPLLRGGDNVAVALRSNGVLPVEQLNHLNGIEVEGMSVDFPGLTNLSTTLTLANLTALDGAVVSVPNLRHHRYLTRCHTAAWRARGAGSRLEFPNLESVEGAQCGWLDIEAIEGGQIQLGRLTQVNEGVLNFLADGEMSLINLSALDRSLATARTISLKARNRGTVSVPLLEGGPTVTINIESEGSLDASQMTVLKGLTLSSSSLVLPGLTNLFAGDLALNQSAQLSFPNLIEHDQSRVCFVNSWSVSGPGSVLDLSSLRRLTGSRCGSLDIKADSGGTINLDHLATIGEGRLNFLSDGPSSLIDLERLQASESADRAVVFEVRNAGKIEMPQMTGGKTVGITLRSNGVLNAHRLETANSIIASGAVSVLSNLVHFDGGTMALSNAAVIRVPNLSTYDNGTGCNLHFWQVRGAGSLLDLPALQSLNGGNDCSKLDIHALNGGRLLLSGLTHIPSGAVNVKSDGIGSAVDLSSLENFLNPLGKSRLEATNGGTILLNAAPFLLSGVQIHLPSETQGLPPASFSPNHLILHGRAWHSYQVESRNSSPPGNEWELFRHVPLTNEFQIIAASAKPGIEFRTTEFVADPAELALAPIPGEGAALVFFSQAGLGFTIETTTNLHPTPVWEVVYTVVSTNTFRLLPTEPLSTPQRYFRIVETDFARE